MAAKEPEESVEQIGIDQRDDVEEGDGPEQRDRRTPTVAEQLQEIDPGGPDPR